MNVGKSAFGQVLCRKVLAKVPVKSLQCPEPGTLVPGRKVTTQTLKTADGSSLVWTTLGTASHL
jgi:hypothetical protein